MAKEYIERRVLPENEYYSVKTIINTIMEYVGEQTVSKYPSSAECNAARKGAEGVIYALEEVPAADVVEVVRCKDCKHWERYPAIGFESISPDGSCERLWAYHDAERCMTAENHFCSYGERKEK